MKDVDFVTEERCLRPSLRIALVTETWAPEVNGVAMTLGRMVDGLIARGHRVQLVRPKQTLSDQAADQPGFQEVLSPGMKIPKYDGLRFGLPARARLFRLWSRQRPDLVHVATEGPLGWSAVSAAARLGIPVTSDFHTRFDNYSSHYGVGWLERPVAAWLKRMHNRTAVTFVPSRAIAQDLRARGYRRVEVIARGVDTLLFNPERRSRALREAWGVGKDGLVAVYVGRVAPEKNLPLVLAAFDATRTKRPDARLVIVGDGPLRKSLQDSRPDVIFAGMRTGADLAAHYASGDLFLFPSLSETWGNVTLEAMASGLCVVAYDCAAAAEVIRAGRDGLVAPPGDEAAFVREACRAAEDPALRRALAESGCTRSRMLDWERIHDRFAAALQGVVNEGPAWGSDFLSFKATVR
ncbi:glycosyltransferase family 1 protein [Azoarcus sp. KH32C]|uniref:glycosyltransferase family 4 protein n=1 Tax=Azoarcus sp. KH32C TaxID=748247 RepID=UPI000238619F|nr:glycosyltransferase family 1 protein [Azoarcus sp. KH32C]BAL25690.1 glycosyltransferase family protein [Azoarcus sp. KH32C]